MALPVTYNYRHLMAHKTTSTLTVLVIAAVVGLSCWLLSFAGILEQSLAGASDHKKLIVLKQGSTSESNSSIRIEEFNRLSQLSGVSRVPGTNRAMISPEMMVQAYLPRLRDGGKTFCNVAMRGVTELAFDVHKNVSMAEGRRFSVGTPEVIVGLEASKQFGGLKIGDTLSVGSGAERSFTVVGHFSAGAGPMESEIWGYLPALMNAFNREMYSSAHVRIANGTEADDVIARIAGPPIEMGAETEASYWKRQSTGIRGYLFVASVLAAVMGLAAVLSIANTMYATVAGRKQEVAMLRTIGYPKRSILASFLIESAILSLAGGILGCLGCVVWLAAVSNTKDMFGFFTFTTLAFKISLTPSAALIALVSVTLAGMLGSLFPALHAANAPVVSALREP